FITALIKPPRKLSSDPSVGFKRQMCAVLLHGPKRSHDDRSRIKRLYLLPGHLGKHHLTVTSVVVVHEYPRFYFAWSLKRSMFSRLNTFFILRRWNVDLRSFATLCSRTECEG